MGLAERSGIRWWSLEPSDALGGGRQGVDACWESSSEGGMVVLLPGLPDLVSS
jgi:hypothetical protein